MGITLLDTPDESKLQNIARTGSDCSINYSIDVLLLPALLLLLPNFSGLILSYNCDPPIQKINTLGTFLQLLLFDDSLYEAKLLQTLFHLYFLNPHWQPDLHTCGKCPIK